MTATILALTLTVSAPALKEKVPSGPPHVGRWAATQLVRAVMPSEQWKGLEYEFTTDGRWLIYRDGKLQGEKDRTYTITGGVIDLVEGPTPYPGVYVVEKGTLTVCFQYNGAGRPKDVTARGVGLMTVTFKRTKND